MADSPDDASAHARLIRERESNASQIDLEDVATRWMCAMRRGEFEEAWRQTDRIESVRRRREATGGFVRQPEHLVWNGTPLDGRRVLIRCSHGLGDTLQFIRYLPLVRSLARSVTVLIQAALLPLFERERLSGEVRNGWTDEPPPFDVEVEVMELAYVFRSTPATLPRTVPYLDTASIRACAKDLPAFEPAGVRAGLLWAASEWDTSRSIPLRALAALGRVSEASFYSLQQASEADEWRDAGFAVVPYSRHTANIEAAAAAMLGLDLIITVDAMAAHLAGALGVPVWLLLKRQADWRWMDDRDDSPWYPTMRIFRQAREGDWARVAEDVTTALARLARAA